MFFVLCVVVLVLVVLFVSDFVLVVLFGMVFYCVLKVVFV